MKWVLIILLTFGWAPPTSSAQSVPECTELSLYCIQLLPTRDYLGALGHVEMARPSSPFGLTVTREGRQRYELLLDIDGLPELGRGEGHYVLWASTLTLDPVINLGEVGNGHHEVGEISFNKFMLIVSREAELGGEQRKGSLVLRGRSPSSRMEPHDMFQLASYTESAETHVHGEGDKMSAKEWPHPVMHPRIDMMPYMMGLKPSVNPWLPDSTMTVPLAAPRSVRSMADGDSLELRAHFVRKRLAGRDLIMLGYNGQIPGPLIDVPQATTITVTFINDTPFESSIHWHGLRHDNRFDGVPGLTQDPVPPGGSFVYTVHFPDPGIYWYHPHHREDIQQDLGLYGNMLVRSPDLFTGTAREEILVFDDLTLTPTDNVPYGQEEANYALMGRFGNVLLVNGEQRVELNARTGEPVRWFLTNVANTRTMNLSVDGMALKLVASDLGAFEQETWVESVPIAPAERYIVEMAFSDPGSYALVNHVQALNHTTGVFFPERDTLAIITVEGPPTDAGANTTVVRHDVMAGMDPFREWIDVEPTHEVELLLRTEGLVPVVDWVMKVDQVYFHPIEWSGTMPMMNWSATAREVEWVIREPSTGLENMDVHWHFDVGSTAKIRIHNLRDAMHGMQHPIHLHGQRFLVVDYNGRPTDNLVWKDTVLIPAGMSADIVVEFTNPGDWMMHCHIAEHLESGMMTMFTVK
ncbi:MAG: multicopper oxidase family protein [Bacteroidetes bacterium]|nr:multicopper oxidase family protein [Bacteroidota bacterium]